MDIFDIELPRFPIDAVMLFVCELVLLAQGLEAAAAPQFTAVGGAWKVLAGLG